MRIQARELTLAAHPARQEDSRPNAMCRGVEGQEGNRRHRQPGARSFSSKGKGRQNTHRSRDAPVSDPVLADVHGHLVVMADLRWWRSASLVSL